MISSNKVVWTEGMFLRPQHFQQFERYVEHYVQSRTAPLQGYFWGFRELAVDRDALALGKFVLRSGQGVMPDGTPFSFDDVGDAPAALDVPPEARHARIMLALPRKRAGAEDVTFDENEQQTLARYQAHEYDVADSNAVALEPATLQLGRLRLRLVLENELNDEWLGLPVARVAERRGDNLVVLDEHYVPPCLAAGQQPLLADFVKELHGLLEARSQALAARLSQPGRGVAETADFLLLTTVNRWLGSSWHAQQFPALHPERLFHDWMMLACELASHTAPGRRPQVWPAYRHDDMQPAFAQLMAELRRSLSAVLERSAMEIPLHDRGQGVSVASIADPALLRTAGFVLAVRADLPADMVRTRFPAQVKIGPVERIRDLVHLQLPGVAVRALPVAPPQIPYSAGHSYFELDKGGEFWRQLEKSGALALHLAGDFPGLTMEFWAIRD